jgi:PHD/YefM family antitoxin component YafN of YafNO toxin-antitoxin module
MKETLEVLSDPGLMEQIRASLAEIAEGKRALSLNEVFGESPARRRKKRR